jgi:phytoene synthase
VTPESAAYAAQYLCDNDRDRYLATLVLPAREREAVTALYAFNADIASVRDRAREPAAGEIRLQWWRDALTGTGHGNVRQNPLADALLSVVAEYGLPTPPLTRMITARRFDLYQDPMPDLPTFEGYAGETSSALLQLGTLILDPDNATAAAEGAGHAGIAQLVAGCLLLMPLHRSRHQVYLPGDILASVGLDAAGFLDANERDRTAAALSAFIGYGRDHLKLARDKASHLTPAARQAFLTVALVEPVFRLAEKAGSGVLDGSIQPSQLSRQWRLWRAKKRLF